MKKDNLEILEQDANVIDKIVNYINASGREWVSQFEIGKELFDEDDARIVRSLRVKAMQLTGDNSVIIDSGEGDYKIPKHTIGIMNRGGFIKIWKDKNKIIVAPVTNNKIVIWAAIFTILVSIIVAIVSHYWR